MVATSPVVIARRRQERDVAGRYAGGLAWGTIGLSVALSATWVAIFVAGAAGALPLWVGLLANTIVAYGFYTVHHEATHGNIGGQPGVSRLDRVLGRLSAVPLTLSFDGYAPFHLAHHAHTNHPERDPDHAVAGSPLALPLKWLLGVLLVPLVRALPWLGPALAARLGLPQPTPALQAPADRLRRFEQLCLLVLIVGAFAGVGRELLLLWWLPGRLSALILMVVFQWLPHHPHQHTDRYRNTRVRRFPASSALLLLQDHHLIHHLYPRVPWFRYGALFRAVRPLLEAEGARLEGLPSARPRAS